ncbi:diguanylate cyclase domain-containing protein [Cellvibrio sp. UBA7661]|uniref:diguanylate cyclase domain-containing protein n=1 Tax=Cellvibrio sp. UBA7661 TaxID=1946311 RepID=UPI002F3506E1
MERHLLRTLGDNVFDLIYAKDEQGRFIYANAALVAIVGAKSPDEILGKTDFDLNPPDVAQAYRSDDQQVMRSGQPLMGREEELRDYKTGELRWHSTTKVPLLDDQGKVIGIVGITRDITQFKRAEFQARDLNAALEQRVAERTAELSQISAALEQERNLMRTLVDALPDAIFVKDIHSKFLLANEAVARGMGTTPEQLLGKDDFDFFPEAMAQQFFNDEQRILQTGEGLINREELAVNKETGQMRWLLTTKLPVKDAQGNIVGLVGLGRDISERKRAEERIHFLATHDSLTQLPNRYMFSQLVDLAIQSAQRYQRGLAILFIDLDGFKRINDTWGHDAGDLLLSEMARRFKQSLRVNDIVGRLGGDEFVILLPETNNRDAVAKIAEKILQAAREEVYIEEQACHISASIGISLYPNDASDEKSLMKQADSAMYRAKQQGKNNYQFYSTQPESTV